MEVTDRVRLVAENAKLRAELQDVLTVKVPEYTRFEGALPDTLEAFEKLPEQWRRQILAEHPDHVPDLVNRKAIGEQMAAAEKMAAKRARVLRDLPVKDTEAFNALPKDQRRDLAAEMTGIETRALTGADFDRDDLQEIARLEILDGLPEGAPQTAEGLAKMTPAAVEALSLSTEQLQAIQGVVLQPSDGFL